MTVGVAVTGGPFVQVQWTSQMNAQDALERAFVQVNNSQVFVYGLEYFGPLGYLVCMINQTFDTFSNSSAPYYYWEFLVNGVPPANTGIDTTYLKDGDTVGFAFSPYVPEKHAGTTLAVKHKFKTTGKLS